MELLVSENRHGEPSRFNAVRVFVDRDYNYGYWIDEMKLFKMLDDKQKKQYTDDLSYRGGIFNISKDTAKKIVECGITPYNKQVIK